MSKKNLLVIFGGASTEHEVSCKSVLNVIANIDSEKYEIFMIGITKDGQWLRADTVSDIENNTWYNSHIHANFLPDAHLKSLYIFSDDESYRELIHIDVVIPVLHGKNGEDGTIQGLFELAHIPYVGCGVLASAVSMDKLYTKVIVDRALSHIGVRQAKYVSIVGTEIDSDESIDRVESTLSYPVFVKPSNAGSSYGVSKAHDRTELIKAIREAASVDRKILVEENIVGREVECAVLSSGTEVMTSGVGEILAAADFYDYDAKYNNPESMTVINADIREEDRELIKKAAEAVFRAVDGYGLSRVDFFLTDDGVVFNEINTLPGFTAISMYPMLWEESGIDKKELMDRLIKSAYLRYER